MALSGRFITKCDIRLEPSPKSGEDWLRRCRASRARWFEDFTGPSSGNGSSQASFTTLLMNSAPSSQKGRTRSSTYNLRFACKE